MLEILGKIGFDWQVAVANLVNFLIIFWLLKRFAFAPIGRILSERQAKIQAGIEKEVAATESLRQAEEAADDIAHAARSEAGTIVRDASAKGESIISAAEATAETRKAEIVASAEQRAVSLRKEAELEFKRHAVALVVKGTRQVIAEGLDQGASEKLAQSALAKIA